ncbi:hypothetical protein NL676_038534 [Syzygium grande]|nr:hypothetical protein NL676_038534 [Syzygium grande]
MVFRNHKPRSAHLVEEATNLYKFFVKWNPSKGKQKGEDRVSLDPGRWLPPPLGTLKLNGDPSWCSESRKGSVVGVCRDANGLLVTDFAKKIHAMLALIA